MIKSVEDGLEGLRGEEKQEYIRIVLPQLMTLVLM